MQPQTKCSAESVGVFEPRRPHFAGRLALKGAAPLPPYDLAYEP